MRKILIVVIVWVAMLLPICLQAQAALPFELIKLSGNQQAVEHKYKFASFRFKEKYKKKARQEERVLNSRTTAVPTSFDFDFDTISDERIRFAIGTKDSSLNRITATFKCAPDELFFGGGEQYSHFVLNGHEIPIWVEEQGVGRGDAPVTFFAKFFGAAGDQYTTYFPIPVLISNYGRAIFLENTAYIHLDLKKKGEISITVWADEMKGQLLQAEDMQSLISDYTEITGRMTQLPEWAYGSWLGLQGGREKVTEIVNSAIGSGNPVTAVWIQDWVGKRKTTIGSRLWWNWVPDTSYYPNLPGFCKEMEQKGVKTLAYINPFLAEEAEMAAYAIDNDLLVKDVNGNPYLVAAGGGFNAYMMDLTNPECERWVKSIIKINLIGNGFSGWMADFAEWLPVDAVLHSGISAWEYHNQYPVDWARINREAINEAGKAGEVIFFSRSGFTGSAAHSTLFWTGDQLVTYGKHDGLRSAITALHSGGMSGISINHSDIGGYTSIKTFPLSKIRSRDLLYRWTEMNVFMPVFRTHEGLKPLKNFQFYTDDAAEAHFTQMAQLHFALKPYIKKCVTEASLSGLPVIRHPFLMFPDDEECLQWETQFMLGEDILVAPAHKKKQKKIRCYLPEGDWIYPWTSQLLKGNRVYIMPAPYGEPCFLIRANGPSTELLKKVVSDYQTLKD